MEPEGSEEYIGGLKRKVCHILMEPGGLEKEMAMFDEAPGGSHSLWFVQRH